MNIYQDPFVFVMCLAGILVCGLLMPFAHLEMSRILMRTIHAVLLLDILAHITR